MELPPILAEADDTTLAGIAVVGLAVVGMFWSLIKRLLKLALFFGVVAAVGWFWYTQR